MKKLLALALLMLVSASFAQTTRLPAAKVVVPINETSRSMIVWYPDGSKCIITYSGYAGTTNAVTQTCTISSKGPNE